MTNNNAAWIKAPKQKLEVDSTPDRSASTGEVVVHAVSIQPVDWKIRAYDFFVKEYPFILGTDVAGTVEEVGEGVSHVKKGDRVLGHALGLGTGDARHSGFQQYAVIHGTTIAKIPDSVSFEHATVLPLALSTASAGLYQPGYLELPFPSATSPSATNKSILVWGGSSSVGSAAIQLAKASGLRVVATASPANHDNVKALGADVVVDYKDEKVVEKLVEALKGTEFAGVYDAISENGSVEASAKVAHQVGGKQFIATVLPPPEKIPGDVKAAGVFAVTIGTQHSEVGIAVYQKFVSEALENGSLKCKPEPLVVGHGLEKIDHGLDVQQKGVSFKKVVVTIA
ncbi:zinc-binding alcohol dehydrogenase family protein [Sporobolomyces salmoneus]|uniref:zinc-binding alcohol dehydrogenase family protein n=1 Tax=Sporobolomyces salmoneus TaxID=183962 RepID=UPI00317B05D7